MLALVFGFIMQMFDNLLSSMNSDAAYSSITGSMAALLLTIISIFVLFQIPQVAQSWGSGISAGVADAARSTGSSMQALGNMGSHGMFGGNAFRAVIPAAASNRQVEEVAATAEEAVVLI